MTLGIHEHYGDAMASEPGVPDLRVLDVAALRLLQAIAEHGTLTAAAVALGSSQPAVSQHVRRLERRLGIALLDRSGPRVRLTEAGQALARHGAGLNAAVRAAGAEVAALALITAPIRLTVVRAASCQSPPPLTSSR